MARANISKAAGGGSLRRAAALLTLLLALPAAGRAQYEYEIHDGAVTLTKYIGSDNTVDVPATLGPLPVTAIGSGAFAGCASLVTVTIPDSVTNIGGGAFQFCANLAGVALPGHVTAIADGTFFSCGALTGITIPASVTVIGDGAFQYCASLTGVTIPDGVASIGTWAFAFCANLTAITVDTPNPAYRSVEGVLFDAGQATLIQCPGGKAGDYVIPDGVTSIGSGAFDSCGRLTGIAIPGSLTSIESRTFDHCSSLAAITVDPSNPAYRDLDGVLFDRTQTTLIRYPEGGAGTCTVPGGVTSIAGYAFSGCDNLAGVYFRGDPPDVDPSAFDGTEATVYYLPEATGWGAFFGDRPAVLWNPQVQAGGAGFGVRTNQFGFAVTGAGNLVVVVEACTDLAQPDWAPLQTNSPGADPFYFSDPEWKSHPGRFYRLRSP